MIREALDAFATALGRTFAAREQTVGGSDVGKCARQVFFEKHEADPEFGAARNPDAVDGWGARLRGTIFEQHFWTPALRAKYGARLLFAGDQQETFALGFLSATPDALLIACEDDALAALGIPSLGGDGSVVLEGKTIDPRARLDGPRLPHSYQAQVQMGLLHELTCHRPEYALISYADASFWDLVYEYPVRRDPKIFATAQRRAPQIPPARAAPAPPPAGGAARGPRAGSPAAASASAVPSAARAATSVRPFRPKPSSRAPNSSPRSSSARVRPSASRRRPSAHSPRSAPRNRTSRIGSAPTTCVAS